MKLYTYDPAPNPRRVGLFLHYKGLEIPTQQVDMMAKEQLGDAFRAINPDGTLPALVLDDGTVMTEVVGICAYLEGLHPAKPLLGVDHLQRALVLSWDHRLFSTIITAVAEVLRNSSERFANRGLPGPLDLPQIPELADRGRRRLAHAWPELDRTLAGREWLVGDGPTLADIDLLIAAEFAGWVKMGPPEECTHLQAFLERARAALS